MFDCPLVAAAAVWIFSGSYFVVCLKNEWNIKIRIFDPLIKLFLISLQMNLIVYKITLLRLISFRWPCFWFPILVITSLMVISVFNYMRWERFSSAVSAIIKTNHIILISIQKLGYLQKCWIYNRFGLNELTCTEFHYYI